MLELTAPTMANQFVPLSWAFLVYMEGKIKLADVTAIGNTFIDILRDQGKLLGNILFKNIGNILD